MKFIHLSDLHLGKRVNEYSMIEDQRYILAQIIDMIHDEKPDGVLIAGDVYDKSVPSEEAMQLWDDFLNRLAEKNVQTFVISGNHDSAVRLSVNNRLIERAGIHIASSYDANNIRFVLTDQYGDVNIYMLPFIKPIMVKQFFQDEAIESYTDACRVAINHMEVDVRERNIIIAHQFVTGASVCDSEEIVVGGLDNVDASVFEDFDYVALGHIHGPQTIGRDTIRYCGTPLKYSLSEKGHTKSVTIIEMGEKNDIRISTRELNPRHDMREIRGTFEELTNKENYENVQTDDYLHVVLTDEEDILEAMSRLRAIYPNIMRLSYDNTRTRENRAIKDVQDIEKKSPIDLFDELYAMQNNQSMSDEQRAFTQELIDSIWGEN